MPNPTKTRTTTTATRATTKPETPGRGSFDRALPHSADAERALLGAMLQDAAAIGEAITELQGVGGEAFFFPRHEALYDHMVDMYDGSRPIDGVVIADELTRRGVFESLGGYDYLGELVAASPSAYRAAYYARIVREKHLLRRLIGASHKVIDVAFEDKQAAAEVLDYAEKEIFEVTEQRVLGGSMRLPDLVAEVFRQIEEHDGSMLTGLPTGYLMLDELTSGLQNGELIIVAGRPSMGKTALGVNMAEHMAFNADTPVLFFSLEMSRQQLAQRILCSRARVDSQAVRRGRLDAVDLQRLQDAANDIHSKPFLIDDTSSLTILELRARSRMAWRKHGTRAIFVDYLQLMRAPGTESRQQEVAEISRGLKALAKELNLPVIAMAQLNRNTEDRSGNKPRMSDLRESGAIEQDADVVALLHRESYYKVGVDQEASQDTDAELIIAKQRNGPVDTVPLHFNRKYTRFDNPQFGARYANVPEAGGG